MANNITSSNTDLTQLRPTIAKEMDGEFVRCPIDEFLKAYLPFAPDEAETKHFVRTLLQDIPSASTVSGGQQIRSGAKPKRSILLGDEELYQLRHYPKLDIKRSTHGSEIVAYQAWVDIAQAIGNIQHPQDTRKRNQYTYRNMPSKRIAADIQGSNNKIDAAFIRTCELFEPLRTTDIAVVIEQKLSTADNRKNALQAVSANVQIMNDDIRRMFTFGITIESDEVTLWYHSRSHSAASERFSFIQNPKLLIKVLTAFLFATDEELGYDPMVTREKDGLYTFKIPDPVLTDHFQRFRTVETLSEYRSNNITGRMARVYQVTKLDDNGEAIGGPLVLKDVWLDNSAKTEREIQNAIFDDIERFWQTPTKIEELRQLQEEHKQLVKDKGYRQYFLAIVLDHSGTTTTHYPAAAVIEKGILLELDLKEASPTTGTGVKSTFSGSRSRNENTHPVESRDFTVPVAPRTFGIKKHYRVVFQEVCKTVGTLGTLGEVVNVLHQALTPLQLLLCAGWVHRDISSGNIMAYRSDLDNIQEPWQVKLADLEYAKKFPPPNDYEASADPKTGTPYFMPLEVMLKRYLNSTDMKEDMQADRQRVSAVQEARAARARATAVSKLGSSRIVVHNFQHDLESLWWILLWTVTCRIKSGAAYGKPIFVNQMEPTKERYDCFMAYSLLGELEKCIAPPKSEDDIGLAASIEGLRRVMKMDYAQRIGNAKLFKAKYFAQIHKDFADSFMAMQTTASEWSSTPLIIHSAKNADGALSVTPGRMKRERSEENIADPRQVEGEGKSQSKLAKMDDSAEGKSQE
ncbi:hypothetical protein CVT25_006359 [Psilocybe cyanescens]|uniref:Protein kinase domain-containing protein n=1 Tax=Psilocybe cyanescens TaxID=93625 RepID=A0A409XH02_PSICY|nr:hypothetical protein CVT25_006359 [Psilocybe cyanescens]